MQWNVFHCTLGKWNFYIYHVTILYVICDIICVILYNVFYCYPLAKSVGKVGGDL